MKKPTFIIISRKRVLFSFFANIRVRWSVIRREMLIRILFLISWEDCIKKKISIKYFLSLVMEIIIKWWNFWSKKEDLLGLFSRIRGTRLFIEIWMRVIGLIFLFLIFDRSSNTKRKGRPKALTLFGSPFVVNHKNSIRNFLKIKFLCLLSTTSDSSDL